MDEMELIIFGVSGFLSFKLLIKWYSSLIVVWPPERGKPARVMLGALPVVSLFIIIYTLKTLASFDVVDDIFYIFFYILIGFAWLYLGLFIMTGLFDLSWLDDILNMNNKAALSSFAGGFLGLTIIYSAANIGDGPGWWCVIFAGGLGLIAWIVLALIINLSAQVFERVTVDRDVSCGIRFGCYLLASGIILGRASAGDWTSFSMTVVELVAGWPVLPLTMLMIVIERFYIYKAKKEDESVSNNMLASILWGIIFIIIAVASIIVLTPMNENPIYRYPDSLMMIGAAKWNSH